MLELISIAFAFTIVTVSPGPANIALSLIAMRSGRVEGLLFGLGLGVGLGFWGIIAASGLGALLQTSADLLFVLKLFGAGYLLWLAWQFATSAVTPKDVSFQNPALQRAFRRGLLLNLSNPKAVVAWIAALSVGMGSGDSVVLLITATSLCVVIGFLNYAGYALLFSLPGAMSVYRRIGRWVDGVIAGAFALAELGLIRSAFSRS